MKYKFFAVLICVFVLIFCVPGVFAAEQVKKADLVFFIDASASMGDEITGVKENLAAFANSLVSQDIDARFAIISFKDDVTVDWTSYTITSRTHQVVIHDFSGDVWTSDVSEVEAALESIRANGSDETQTQALAQVLNWDSFRSDASHFGFLLTDEDTEISPYDTTYENEQFYTIDDLVPRFNAIPMSISVISLLELREHYLNLFSETGGAFIDISQENYYRSMLSIAQWIAEQANTASSDRLPYAMIEAVPETIFEPVAVGIGDRYETPLERIARYMKILSTDINVLTDDNISEYDLQLPHEPTAAMRRSINGTFVAKLDTITLYSDFLEDGEEGYFLFQLNVPDEVLAMNLNFNNLKFWYATPDEFDTSATDSQSVRASGTAWIDFWIFNQMGMKIDTPVKKILVLLFGNTGRSLALFLVRTILALLFGGVGCNLAGPGSIGIITASGVILLRKFFRK